VVLTTKLEKILKEFLDIIKTVSLFKEINDEDIEFMLNCLQAEIKAFPKNSIILMAGEKPQNVGVVLEGLIHIVNEDVSGTRTLIEAVSLGGTFAEAFCCAGISASPVTIVAAENSKILWLKFDRVVQTCANSCTFHNRLIENMLKVVADKNLYLQNRMEVVSMKSIRDKVLHYLESFSGKQGSRDIVIPFNREEMADYLCVDRSALSHELARMKEDGLLDYKKNIFTLKVKKR